VNPLTGDSQTLTLLPQHGQGINLDLNEKLVHVLARLLQQTATAAEWGLALNVTAGADPDAAPLQPAPPRLLH